MKKIKLLTIAIILLMPVYYVNAVSIGISPGKVKFENVLKGGYSERTVTISTASDEELLTKLQMKDETKDWLRLEPNETTFRVSKSKPYKLKIIAEPKPDLRTGNYSGSIEFVTEVYGGVSGRAGALVKTAVGLSINLELTGKEIVKCRAGAYNFQDAEVGFPFEFWYTVVNDGNVRLKPVIDLDIWDQLQEKLLLTKKFTGSEVLPTTEKKIVGTFPNNLDEGQYWINMKVDECKSNGFLTFTVVEKGGIIDRGDLKEIVNKPWAVTNETVQITAKFQNEGKRSVAAKFKGTIRLEDKIVKLIETEEVFVPASETNDFDIFFAPQTPGRYTITGRVIYNKKLTYEKGTVINVNPPAEEEKPKKVSMLPLVLYVTIIVTILFIVRKIVKEKKKKNF